MVNWENINQTEKGDFKISEITAHEKTASILESNFIQSQLKYQLVTIEFQGHFHSYFLEVFSNKGSTIYPETTTKLNDFTGTLSVFLLNGENLGSVAIYDGRAQNISKNDDLNVLAASINAFATKSSITSKMPQCGGYYTAYIDRTTSRYDVWTVGDKIVAINYFGTTTTRSTSILPFPCDGNYDKEDILNQRLDFYNFKNGSGGGESTATPQIFNELTGKAKCLNDLLTKNGDSFVKGILVKFEGKSTFNVRLVSVDKVFSKDQDANGNYPEVNGHTEPAVGNEIVIKISTTKSDENSSLDLVRTILHEYIHADLSSKTFTESYKGKSDFETVVNMYGIQHNDMATNYLKGMKEALKKFHKTVLTDDYNKYTNYYEEEPSDAFYEALAWGGLRDNNVKSWRDLPADKKAAIEKLANRTAMLSRMAPCN